MDKKTGISSFAKKLKAAMTGDLSGWKCLYENAGGGPTRYILKDPHKKVYDAYVHPCGKITVLDPHMREIGAWS